MSKDNPEDNAMKNIYEKDGVTRSEQEMRARGDIRQRGNWGSEFENLICGGGGRFERFEDLRGHGGFYR